MTFNYLQVNKLASSTLTMPINLQRSGCVSASMESDGTGGGGGWKVEVGVHKLLQAPGLIAALIMPRLSSE